MCLLPLDVVCQSEPLQSPGRGKESAESQEEESAGEAGVGCKSGERSGVTVLWRSRCATQALVSRDSAPDGAQRVRG